MRAARAVVYFRLLRSVGSFRRVGRSAAFTYCPCKCGKWQHEPLPNGMPEPAGEICLRAVVDEYARELGILCDGRYPIE